MKLDFKFYLRIPIILSTFVVFLAAIVLIRLGLWQIDRYYERAAFNRNYLIQTSSPVLVVTQAPNEEIVTMEYRKIKVTGSFDESGSIVRINQYHDSELGYSLMTPLILSDGSGILIDRGWIPLEGNEEPQKWVKYSTTGIITIEGVIRKSRSIDRKDLSDRPKFWVDFDANQLQQLYAYPIAHVFVQKTDDKKNIVGLPIPLEQSVEITDGPHIGYALQWFTFAILLLSGYPFFLKTKYKDKAIGNQNVP